MAAAGKEASPRRRGGGAGSSGPGDCDGRGGKGGVGESVGWGNKWEWTLILFELVE